MDNENKLCVSQICFVLDSIYFCIKEVFFIFFFLEDVSNFGKSFLLHSFCTSVHEMSVYESS